MAGGRCAGSAICGSRASRPAGRRARSCGHCEAFGEEGRVGVGRGRGAPAPPVRVRVSGACSCRGCAARRQSRCTQGDRSCAKPTLVRGGGICFCSAAGGTHRICLPRRMAWETPLSSHRRCSSGCHTCDVRMRVSRAQAGPALRWPCPDAQTRVRRRCGALSIAAAAAHPIATPPRYALCCCHPGARAS